MTKNENGSKGKQRSTKYTHTSKDRVTRTLNPKVIQSLLILPFVINHVEIGVSIEEMLPRDGVPNSGMNFLTLPFLYTQNVGCKLANGSR